ncbi:MAG: pyrroline-5-carboxylate reductase [Acidobacteria bacterium]|nr:pyrroline-5-carboxylate reductase [Acidobacteriota bacterium]
MTKGNEISAKTGLAFIGCGVMAESMIAGLLREKIVTPKQIAASHPRRDRREELKKRYGIKVFADNAAAARAFRGPDSAVVLCVKPQRMNAVLHELAGAVTAEQLVISIVAGATIGTIAETLDGRLVVRAMPNTPSQIGKGMTAWTCSADVDSGHKQMVKVLLSALGTELFVETENMIDMATSLSATGPTYTFLVMEAMTDAGVHLGFSREVSKELVLQTMLGSVLFAMESHKHPAELRNMVTSPGGTSAEAIYQMEKGALRTVLSKAIYGAYRRAVELGKRK